MQAEAALSALRARLDSAGFRTWYVERAGAEYSSDPWKAFACVNASPEPPPGQLALLSRLFIEAGGLEDAELATLVETPVVGQLARLGILARDGSSRWTSRYCLLVVFGRYLFVDWPAETSMGSYSSAGTYLSSGSFECVHAARDAYRGGDILDLGSGTGIVTLAFASSGGPFSVVERDPHAAGVSKLNFILNGVAAKVLVADWRNCHGELQGNALIVANPPWRIVPDEVVYPNRDARVGPGHDGLDAVRTLIAGYLQTLSVHGSLILRYDQPISPAVPDPLALVGSDYDVVVKKIAEIPARVQSRLSAGVCGDLNRDPQCVEQRFIAKYAELECSQLEMRIVSIRRLR